MKINAQWLRHVEAWRESGLSLADYCRQQGLNRKTFLAWTRRIQAGLSMDQHGLLELISVQVAPAPVATAEASAIMLRLAHGFQLVKTCAELVEVLAKTSPSNGMSSLPSSLSTATSVRNMLAVTVKLSPPRRFLPPSSTAAWRR